MSNQLAVLRGVAHEALTSSDVPEFLDAADAQRAGLDHWRSANLREIGRAFAHPAALPQNLVLAMSKAISMLKWFGVKRAE